MANNPNYLGRYSYFYYQEGDFDITTGTVTDAAILGDSNWVRICFVDSDVNITRALTEIIDQCAADKSEYASGRQDFAINSTFNRLRIRQTMDLAALKAYDDMVDAPSVIAVMVLDSDREDNFATGFVVNALVESQVQTHPDGSITDAYAYRPAAESNYSPKWRRVYGTLTEPVE